MTDFYDVIAALVLIVVVAAFPVSWLVNAYKFASCDFESPFKCEVVHGIGVFVPPSAIITVWVDDDGK